MVVMNCDGLVVISGVTRALIGGVYIHIFVFCPTNFFLNEFKNKEIQKKFVWQNTNI
jgi:hypothetical protein